MKIEPKNREMLDRELLETIKVSVIPQRKKGEGITAMELQAAIEADGGEISLPTARRRLNRNTTLRAVTMLYNGRRCKVYTKRDIID